MPPESDVIRVRHIVDAAQSALTFAAGRSRPAHAYFDVDPAVVWATVSEDLEPLVVRLTAWLEEQ